MAAKGWPRRTGEGSPYAMTSAAPLVLTRHELGFDPAVTFTKVVMQFCNFTGVGAPKISIRTLGIGGKWTPSGIAPKGEDEVVYSTEPFDGFELTLTAGEADIFVAGIAQGF